VDEVELKALLDRFDTTACVVTSAFEGRRDGCLISFVTRCSIDPPRLLVLTSHETLTHSLVEQSGVLAVHPVARGQEAWVTAFGRRSGRHEDKFAGLVWQPGVTGAPVLSDAFGYLEGRVINSLDCGDHAARLIEPVMGALHAPDAVPLTVFEMFAMGLIDPSTPLGNPWSSLTERSSRHRG
jgi:flavin reductase (DIM6/NTAB) family NADH-FMN oxidoreductase RutF